MLLHLIRHAHAEDTSPDEARRLSRRGRAQVRTLAKFLRRTEAFAPEEIWHSTLVRAQETAALLALERAGRHWTVRWHVSPDLLG